MCKKSITGQFIDICGERYYEISNYDEMQPFFISLASDTDLWMYLASTGALTAGRRSPEHALFPYYTDDKITESAEMTGPKTIIKVTVQSNNSMLSSLWEPFSDRQLGLYDLQRKISKSTVGNKIVFSEENLTLGLRFSYLWTSAGKHGWVRRATLENLTDEPKEIELIDGLQNVLPSGVERKTQNEFSTLVDGYKKTELIGNLALFRMEAILVDRAEPSESLRCNTIYTLGADAIDYLVSSKQLPDFRRGFDIMPETESKGVRGALFAHQQFTLAANTAQPASKTWYFVCDTDKDAVEVRNLMQFASQEDATEQIEAAISLGTEHLRSIVAHNDGVQHTDDEYNDARHFANTLFNTMRGGYYLNDYNISGKAFAKHIAMFNHAVAEQHAEFLQSLPTTINRQDLETKVLEQHDNQLTRLFYEYLPITFGRRHGDPSRPWNMFDIRVQDEAGNPIVSYQGNWRDIFQNWEALSLTYPNFVNGIIAKFLNATTVDGYNPYKVTSEGIDWEVIEPENPWSNIGYWGDHQIIYLCKLLELSLDHNPTALTGLLNQRLFAFANVPYRFKSYKEIVADPKNTIRFDDQLHGHIFSLIPSYGQDARLVLDSENNVVLTTMIDKLLITLLAKMTNFVPEAGIWMNTLRPEWNDANNALVGYGTSVVTLAYMRRYVVFLQKLIGQSAETTLTLSKETATLLNDISATIHSLFYEKYHWKIDDMARREIIDAFGLAGEAYRNAVYQRLSGEAVTIDRQSLLDQLFSMEEMITLSLIANKREDGLYHAYNLIKFADAPKAVCEVSHLYPMLEGQVAILSSGLLSAEEAADLLDAMRQSDLYRPDQRSYMLYPARRRKTFLELNNLPAEAKELPQVKKYIGSVIKQDNDGGLHFDASYRNANNLPEELKALYEQVFNHQAFTGRSGTFYKYEGLGCIYWHMVSKLLLAVGENMQSEKCKSQDAGERLAAHYNAIREGIGSHKSPEEYGSFPFDAYSHTPSMAGVQQPGMTGQVKEDILSRFAELGISVRNGEIHISGYNGADVEFTYCSVPFLYKHATCVETHVNASQSPRLLIEFSDSREPLASSTLIIPADLSRHIFDHDNIIKQVIVTL